MQNTTLRSQIFFVIHQKGWEHMSWFLLIAPLSTLLQQADRIATMWDSTSDHTFVCLLVFCVGNKRRMDFRMARPLVVQMGQDRF